MKKLDRIAVILALNKQATPHLPAVAVGNFHIQDSLNSTC